jgi:phosphatidylglycerophosphate synthase
MSNFLKEVGQPLVYRAIHPLIQTLAKAGITPNAITVMGFVINLCTAALFIWGANAARGDLRIIGYGGALILFGGLFDMIDGRLARVSGQESAFGALFDSVLDRYSELVMFLGICYYLAAQHYFISALSAFTAMIGSIMVSYVRARAEGLGVECKEGMMQRPERILTIGISAFLCGLLSLWTGPLRYTVPGLSFPLFESISVFTFPLFVLAILTNLTAIGRIQDTKRALEARQSC